MLYTTSHLTFQTAHWERLYPQEKGREERERENVSWHWGQLHCLLSHAGKSNQASKEMPQAKSEKGRVLAAGRHDYIFLCIWTDKSKKIGGGGGRGLHLSPADRVDNFLDNRNCVRSHVHHPNIQLKVWEVLIMLNNRFLCCISWIESGFLVNCHQWQLKTGKVIKAAAILTPFEAAKHRANKVNKLVM